MMFIQLTCSCGKKLKANTDTGVTSVRCPGCNELVKIKKAGASPAKAEESYTLEGEPEKKAKKAKESTSRPDCFFCGGDYKRRKVLVWTALLGDNVDVRLPNDTVVKQRAYVDLVGHELGVCTPCAKKFWRKYLIWRLIFAIGAAVLLVMAVIFLFVWRDSQKAQFTLYGMYVVMALGIYSLCTVGAIIGLLAQVVFFKVNTDKLERAIAYHSFKRIDPEAEAALSSEQFNGLQPQQIEGKPAKAGPKTPGKPYRR